jgi:hypothetical protein
MFGVPLRFGVPVSTTALVNFGLITGDKYKWDMQGLLDRIGRRR